MKATAFTWIMSGVDGDGNQWENNGTANMQPDMTFPDVLNAIQAMNFFRLTNGDATYGNPGVGGCKGPYRIFHIAVSRLEDL